MAYTIDLSGRVAFVTGASGGLGAQFARTLAAVEPLLGLLGGVASRPDDLLDLVVVQTPS